MRISLAKVLGLISALLLGMAACGDNSEPGADTTTESTSQGSGALEKTRIKVGTIPIAALGQLYVADSEGYFEDEGLEVEATPMAGGATIGPAVQSGEVDIGWSNVISMMLAERQGFEFKLFGGGIWIDDQHNEIQTLVRSDSNIQDYSDLEGKSIAVNTLANINDVAAALRLEEAGVEVSNVRFVEVAHPDIPAALAQGRVDAAISAEPFVTIQKGDGKVRVIDPNPMGAVGEKVFISGWFSTSSWLDTNANTAAAFMRAITRASELINSTKDAEAVREVLPDATELSPELAERVALDIFGPTITTEDIAQWVEAIRELEGQYKVVELDPDFDPASILHDVS